MKILLRVLALTLMLCLCGCGQKKTDTLTVAYQFGTAYAPLELMRSDGGLSDALGVKVEWLQLQNTTAIRESMLSGETDIGFMAIPPFLIGLDGGTEWKIITGLSSMPMGLVTREDVTGLSEIAENARIALPQPGSVQHILLAMAAQRQLGDPYLFDDRLVTLSHPDGMSLLLSGGDISYHFTTAPYLQSELDAGMSLLLSGEDAFGGQFTGIVGAAQNSFLEKNPELCVRFLDALNLAVNRINDDPASSAKIIAPAYSMDETRLLWELTADGAVYDTEIKGVMEFADFMYGTSYIGKMPESEDVFFEIPR